MVVSKRSLRIDFASIKFPKMMEIFLKEKHGAEPVCSCQHCAATWVNIVDWNWRLDASKRLKLPWCSSEAYWAICQIVIGRNIELYIFSHNFLIYSHSSHANTLSKYLCFSSTSRLKTVFMRGHGDSCLICPVWQLNRWRSYWIMKVYSIALDLRCSMWVRIIFYLRVSVISAYQQR